METRIEAVSGYRDRATIHRFVGEVFRSSPAAMDILQNPRAGKLIVVKPNWVQEAHENSQECWEPVITNPEVLLAVIDTVCELTAGGGTLCVCDAPHTYADFHAIISRGNFKERFGELASHWPGMHFELMDLRREIWTLKEQVVIDRRPQAADPRGYVAVDLGQDSLFYGHHGEGRYYGADYDSDVVNEHHRGEVQEYLLSGTAMKCDLFVNVPKLKTHKKTGVTGSLKNLVGINGDKNWLPHHTQGTPGKGGDEFAGEGTASRIEKSLKKLGQRVALRSPRVGGWVYQRARKAGKRVFGDSDETIRNGNWHGNDTCWRMALDLNRAFLYGNSDGMLGEAGSMRPYVTIMDGIVGGEGNGPLCPDPVSSGVILGGTDPAVVDAAACRLMGYDPECIPIIREAFTVHRWPIAGCALADVRIYDGRLGRSVPLREITPAVPGGFRPHFGWVGAMGEVG